MISQKDLNKSMSFEEYYKLNEELAKNGKSTGTDQSEIFVNYSKLNFSRMKRIVKTIPVSNDVLKLIDCIDRPITWVVLTESWCGDAAQNLPILSKIADLTPHISLKILLRDENDEIMNQYLTNGGKSIPKLICIDEDYNELGTWGPRPKHLQNWLKSEKENPTMDLDELKKQFQIWYTKDKGQSIQKEMITLIKTWMNLECN